MPILNAEQLFALTLRRSSAAQRRILDAICVPYRVHPDKSLVVFTADMQTTQGAPGTIRTREPELRFDREPKVRRPPTPKPKARRPPALPLPEARPLLAGEEEQVA